MRIKSRSILILIAGIGLLYIVSCKKNSSSVVGDWKLTNISGSSRSTSTSLTVTYNSSLKQLSVVDSSTVTFPYSLELNILTGGKYIFKETYTPDTTQV